MRDWSLGVGRLFGIEIRVHIIFPLWALWTLADYANAGVPWEGARILTMLFGLVLLHEFGHCFAGRAVGGRAREILMWPFGGLAMVETVEQPRERMWVTIGGPAVNAAILIVLTPFMFFFDQPIQSVFLWTDSAGARGNYLAELYAINLDLLIFNLIPAFPLDGGSMLRNALWFRLGLRRATEIAIPIGWGIAAIMIVIGLTYDLRVLVFLAILGIFAGIQERQRVRMTTESAYEPWQGDRPPAGIGHWWRERQLRRDARKAEQIARADRDRQQRVDELLEKVSREGINALTPAEKRFMNDVSKHYRNRGD